MDFSNYDISTYTGYIIDEAKLKNSASGGAATELAEFIIKNKHGYVFGVTYSPDFRSAEYCLINKIEDLDKIKGSKYCSSRKIIRENGIEKSVYSVLADLLKKEEVVLFIGLGCDIGAVKMYCEKNSIATENLYCLEILCHGPVAQIVHRHYIDQLENDYHSKLTFFSVRYKKEGWKQFYLKACFENGRTLMKPFYETDYAKVFNGVIQPQCENCRFKGENHKGDLTVGDYWGVTPQMSVYNANGVSLIIVQTDKGKRMLEMFDPKSFRFEMVDREYALKNNPMYLKSKQSSCNYKQFISNMDSKGMHYAIGLIPTPPQNIKIKVKQFIKNIMPEVIIDHFRRSKKGD